MREMENQLPLILLPAVRLMAQSASNEAMKYAVINWERRKSISIKPALSPHPTSTVLADGRTADIRIPFS